MAGLAGDPREHPLEIAGPDRCGRASQVDGGGGAGVDVGGGDLPVAYRSRGGRCRGEPTNLESARADVMKFIGQQCYLAGVADHGDRQLVWLGLVIDGFEGHRQGDREEEGLSTAVPLVRFSVRTCVLVCWREPLRMGRSRWCE